MVVYPDTLSFKTFSIRICAGLSVVVGDDHSADIKSDLLELCTETEHVLVVSYSEITPHLVLFNVQSTYHQHNLSLFFQLKKHLELAVRLKTRQYAARVIVVKQLSSKLQIELVSELSYALLDLFGLYLKIFFVIESRFHTEYKGNFSPLFLQE